MADQKDDNNSPVSNIEEIIDSDELLELEMALDDPDEDLSKEPQESLSDELEDIPDALLTDEAELSDELEDFPLDELPNDEPDSEPDTEQPEQSTAENAEPADADDINAEAEVSEETGTSEQAEEADETEAVDMAEPADSPDETESEISEPIELDEISDLDLDEPDESLPEPEPEPEPETVSSLEKDIEELMDWDEPEADEFFDPDAKQDPDPKEDNLTATDSLLQPETPTEPVNTTSGTKATESAPAKKSGFSLDMANSIMLSLGLVAVLVAAIAIWVGLDASQQASISQAAPKQLKEQIATLEQGQEEQNIALMQQVETLQRQLNALSQVVASNKTEQWRSSVSGAAEKTEPVQHQPAAETAAASKPESAIKAATVAAKPVTADKQADAPDTQAVQKPVAQVEKLQPAATQPSARPAPEPTTELAPNEVAPGTVKGWVVNIVSVESLRAAEMKVKQLKARDIHAQFVRVTIKGKTWFRLRVTGFENEREAVAFKKFLKEYHGINSWHQKLK